MNALDVLNRETLMSLWGRNKSDCRANQAPAMPLMAMASTGNAPPLQRTPQPISSKPLSNAIGAPRVVPDANKQRLYGERGMIVMARAEASSLGLAAGTAH